MGRKIPIDRPGLAPAWAEVTPFYAFSAGIRKIIYTTNAVESLNRVLRVNRHPIGTLDRRAKGALSQIWCS